MRLKRLRNKGISVAIEPAKCDTLSPITRPPKGGQSVKALRRFILGHTFSYHHGGRRWLAFQR
jgi:hypothetical protein